MCGFTGCFGIIDKKIKNTETVLRHRGPDMQGYFEGKDWSLQFNRLSIIDLSQDSMQPFEYDGVKVFLNGEIYNYLELQKEHSNEFKNKTKSDIEIIPFLYRKYGLSFLNKINGMFSIVIIDEKKNNKFLIRDRYGKKPIFYFIKNNNLYFSFEIKSLKVIQDLEVDKTNLAIYFHCGLVPQPLTSYKNVLSVFSGSVLSFNDKKIKEEKWYLPNIKIKNHEFADVKEKFLKLFSESIKLRLRSDVPVGVFLSGGLDSTAILGIAKSYSNKIVALTCKIPEKEKFEGTDIDNIIPSKFCKDINCNLIETVFDYDYFNKNLVKIISKHDEVVIGTGLLIIYALSETAKKNGIKVILMGSAGDEALGGYYWQNKMRLIPNFLIRNRLNNENTLVYKIFSSINIKSNNIFFRKLNQFFKLFFQTKVWHAETHGCGIGNFMGDVKNDAYKKINSLGRENFNYVKKIFNLSDYNHLNFANVATTLNYENYNNDVACMSSSIENRTPFLDYKLFEYLMTISDKFKNSGTSSKKMYSKAMFRKILKTFLPEYIYNKPKSGPTLPIDFWLENRPEVKKNVNDFIIKNSFYIRDFLSKDLYKNLMKNKSLVYGKEGVGFFKILSFIIWAKINIDKSLTDYSVSLEDLVNQ